METKNSRVPAGPAREGDLRKESISAFLERRGLPEHATPVKLIGVNYAHVPTSDGGDLYVTWHGIHLFDHLRVENWYERKWFEANRFRLAGTSTVYRLATKPVNGRSIDLVVKYCRVGEDVPLDTMSANRFSNVAFNSPYEEFALVMEMRRRGGRPRVLTHRPLAIYVPAKRLELWQTGRKEYHMAGKKAKFRDVELDIFRQYVLIYQWVKGISADEAFLEIAGEERRRILENLTESVRRDLEKHGYMVVDHKPAHIIVRPRKNGTVLRKRGSDFAYALVDFELLTRTADHQRHLDLSRRATYLRHQRARFSTPARSETFPEHLKPVTILDVDYVFGHAESTHGRLWVVGHDPELFDYFIPERWRHTPGKKLSETSETHYTLSKDNINLVWKLSRVGEQPDSDLPGGGGRDILGHGFNTPFEEFSIALDMARKGIHTVYPRAIYMSGLESSRSSLYVVDLQRFESHQRIVMEDGQPIFLPDHNYLTIWGYWNGVAEMPEERDEDHLQPIDLGRACERGLITHSLVNRLLERMVAQLWAVGYRDLALKPSHFLLSLRHDKTLILDPDGLPTLRICNFELVQTGVR
jgi:hypothetical protein